MNSAVADFTKGKIYSPLLRFTLPILGAHFLQSTYGAVDLLVVGQFCSAAEVSAVATGGQLLHTVTMFIVGLSMGTTVLLGRRIGEGRHELLGSVMGSAIWLFTMVGLALSVFIGACAGLISVWMKAPAEALRQTTEYISVCGFGMLFIVGYNLLGSVFRGLGDSRTPLLAVLIACVLNIGGDILLVGPLGLGARGAALATTISQGISVLLCLLVVKKRGLPFKFGKRSLQFNGPVIGQIVRIGAPLALQDLLVSFSFLVLMVIINSLGVVASAGVGVAEKICGFIMLVPMSFCGALAAFVAQNMGAGEEERARRGVLYGILTSFSIGLLIAWYAYFHGDVLCGIFARDGDVIAAGADYLRAYAFDVLLTSFLFCFLGYYNGCGRTTFSMAQGLIGAFGVRIPVSYFMSRRSPVSLFAIGMATPSSSLVQILLCGVYFLYLGRKKQGTECEQIT